MNIKNAVYDKIDFLFSCGDIRLNFSQKYSVAKSR